jgi:hypothetical protein
MPWLMASHRISTVASTSRALLYGSLHLAHKVNLEWKYHHVFTANSLSNDWAVAGITRVLATIMNWKLHNSHATEQTRLEFRSQAEVKPIHVLKSMLDCLIFRSRDSKTGLLKTYKDGHGSLAAKWAYGGAAGTALMTSAVYWLAVLLPIHFNSPFCLDWVDQKYKTVTKHIDTSGKITPVVSVRHSTFQANFQQDEQVRVRVWLY